MDGWVKKAGSALGGIAALGRRPSLKDPTNLESVETPQEAAAALKKAVELQSDNHSLRALEITLQMLYVMDKLEVQATSSSLHPRVIGSAGENQKSASYAMGLAGACVYVDQLLGSRLSSPVFCESCLQLICALTLDCPSNRIKLIQLGACYRIVKAIELHMTVPTVLIWGLKCVRYISMVDNEGAKFVTSGACDVVPAALRLNSSNNIVVEMACRIIYNLTHDDEDCNCKLAEAGACELIVVNVLQEHLQTNEMTITTAHWGLRAVGGLARKNSENKVKLANLGSCEVIMQTIKRFSTSFSTSAPDVPPPLPSSTPSETNSSMFVEEEKAFLQEALAESACWAIGNLAYPDESNQNRLASLGACEFVSATLEKYKEKTSVVREAFRAIRNLGHENDKNLEIMTNSGACEMVMNALRFHNAECNTVQWGWFAVATLASRRETILNLESAGACEQVVGTLTRFGSLGDVTQWACMALSKLAVEPDCCSALGDMDSGKLHAALVLALQRNLEDSDVAEEICCAIGSLVLNEKNSRRLADEGACQTVLKVLKKHDSSETMTEQGLQAISIFLDTKDSYMPSRIVGCDACRIVPRVLEKQRENAVAVKYACKIICALAISDSNRDKLASGGAVSGIVSAMFLHANDANIIISCFQCISRMCSSSTDSIIQKLRTSNVYSALVGAINKHRELPFQVPNPEEAKQSQRKLLELGLVAIRDLCVYEGGRQRFASEGCIDAVVCILMVHFEDESIATCAASVLSCLAGGSDKASPVTLLSPSVSVSTPQPQSLSLPTSILPITMLQDKSTISSLSTSSTSATSTSTSYSSNSSSTPNASQSAYNSSDTIAGICEMLGAAGACTALIMALNEHAASADVTTAVCMAIHALSVVGSNRVRFGQARGCESVLQALHMHRQNTGITAVACSALGSLALQDEVAVHSNQDLLGNAGACEMVVDLLLRFSDSVTICEAACRAIAHLASDHTQNKDKFFECSASELIVSSLKKHWFSVTGTIQGILAAAMIGENHRDNCTALSSKGIANEIISAMKKYSQSDVCIEACCRAIYSLHPLNMDFAAAGVCQLIVPALSHHLNNENVAQWICKVLTSLGKYENNKVTLYKCGVCEAITASLQRHVGNESILSVMLMRNTSSAGVAQWGCDAMFSIAISGTRDEESNDLPSPTLLPSSLSNNQRLSISSQASLSVPQPNPDSPPPPKPPKTTSLGGKIIEEYQRRFIAAGACEAVAKALVKYSEVEQVAQACFRAVVILTFGNEIARIRLGNLGVCASIIDSLHLFPSSVNIARWGCAAVAAMADNNCEANITRFGVAGACETLPVAMQAHQNSAHVAESGCAAIANLTSKAIYTASNSRDLLKVASEDGLVKRLGHAGACEAVVSSLRKHTGNSGVVRRACLAMANLSLAKGNACWFGAQGACDALLSSLRAHKHELFVCAAALEATGNLCSEPDNRFRLGDGGACEAAVEALQSHEASSEVAIWASYAVGRLCESGAMKVKTTPTVTPNSSSAQLLSIAQASSSTETSGTTNAAEGTSSVSDQNLPTANSASSTSSNTSTSTLPPPLSIGPGENRARLLKSGVCKALVSTLIIHCDREIAAFNITRAIAILGFGDACVFERDTFGSQGACEAVVMALHRHRESEAVCRSAGFATRALAHNHPENQSKVFFAGGCSGVVQAMITHRTPSSVGVLEALAWATHHLAINNDSDNKSELGKEGACEILVAILEVHGKHVEVAYWATFALYRLCLGNDENRSKIAFSNAADQLVLVLQRYSDIETLCSCVCWLMVELCSDRVGQYKLGTAGASKQVVTLLQKGGIRSDAFVGMCCQLIRSLCLRSQANQNKMQSAGACKVLVSVLEHHLTNAMQTMAYFSAPLPSSTGADLSELRPVIIPITSGMYLPTKTSGGAGGAGNKAGSSEIESSSATGGNAGSKDEGLGGNNAPVRRGSNPAKGLGALIAKGTKGTIFSKDSGTAFASSSNDSLSNPASRYITCIQACKAITALASSHEGNKKKLLATGIHDLLGSFLCGGFGYVDGSHEGNVDVTNSLRRCISDTIAAIQHREGPYVDPDTQVARDSTISADV